MPVHKTNIPSVGSYLHTGLGKRSKNGKQDTLINLTDHPIKLIHNASTNEASEVKDKKHMA